MLARSSSGRRRSGSRPAADGEVRPEGPEREPHGDAAAFTHDADLEHLVRPRRSQQDGQAAIVVAAHEVGACVARGSTGYDLVPSPEQPGVRAVGLRLSVAFHRDARRVLGSVTGHDADDEATRFQRALRRDSSLLEGHVPVDVEAQPQFDAVGLGELLGDAAVRDRLERDLALALRLRGRRVGEGGRRHPGASRGATSLVPSSVAVISRLTSSS